MVTPALRTSRTSRRAPARSSRSTSARTSRFSTPQSTPLTPSHRAIAAARQRMLTGRIRGFSATAEADPSRGTASRATLHGVLTLAHLHSPSGQRNSLSLQRTSFGWALLDDRDRAVFEAEGSDARRRCLAHASALGVLRLTFDEQLTSAPRN